MRQYTSFPFERSSCAFLKIALTLALFLAACSPGAKSPLLRVVDLSIGELREVELSNGTTAQVKLVDGLIDAASGTFGVQLELPNPDRAIPAGLHCEVNFAAGPPDGLSTAV